MRNNQDRLGAIGGGEPPPQTEQQPQQPLQFVTPTELVELPSKGKFYPSNHPLHNVETIEIRHMTAKDEDILTSRSLLQKGVAIDKFLQNIVVDRTINIADLLVGDKNAIIVASRVTGYGISYEANVSCPSCNNSSEYNFNLSECSLIPWDTYKQTEAKLTPDNTFIVHVDKMNVDVEVRLLVSRDEIHLSQISERKRKKKLPESSLTDQLRMLIVSINGNNDVNYIESFIQTMPATDSRKLRTVYQKIVPNVDMSQFFSCSECAFEGEVSVPFGTNFFWPK